MYKAILAFVLFFGSVLPALCEDGSLFLIYSYSPNDRSARSRPIKKVRSAKSRTMNTGWGYNKPDESFDWEVPSIALRSVTANKFMFSNGGVGYGKSVIQTDLNVSFKSGIYFDLWNSLPFKKNKEELGTELDYNMGWTGSIGGKTSIDVGVTYCDAPKMGRVGGGNDVFYSYLKIIQSVGEFSIYGAAENNSVTPGSSFRGGSMLSVGISRSDSYLDKDLNIDMSLEPVYDSGYFGLSEGTLVRGKIGFNWNVEKNLIVIFPQVNYYVPLKVHDSRTSDTAITSGFVYQF